MHLAAPARRLQGGVNTREVSGQARPKRGVVAFTMGLDGQTVPYTEGDETDCRIRLWQRGPYLVVRDNNGCGGLNVTFSAFYRRLEVAAR